jgi:hypothetical protein
MNWKQWTGIFLTLLFAPSLSLAQDARSFAVGGTAAASPNGVFGMEWNPALLSLPLGDNTSTSWSIGSGYSIFDTTNSNSPVLRFNSQAAMQSTADPVLRYQQIQGLFGVQYLSYAGGILYDHEINTTESQGALNFFQNQQSNAIVSNAGATYNLNYLQTTQEIETLILSYSTPIPLAAFPFASVGGSLKYNYGTQYEQTSLTGTYTQGNPGGYNYTRTTSNSGLGLSTDLGLFAKISDALQFGVMLENVTSSFNWSAQQQTISLDQTTGQESVTNTQNITVSAPFPYTTKVGLVATPASADILLDAEADFVNHQTHWKFGLERFYPENNLAIRFGTFNDDVSGDQLWTFGGGYYTKNLEVDLSFVTRSIPNIQDSVALGGALSADLRF